MFVGSKVVMGLFGRNRQAAVTATHGPSWWGSDTRHEVGQDMWLVHTNPFAYAAETQPTYLYTNKSRTL
jgi:hypothetical protein